MQHTHISELCAIAAGQLRQATSAPYTAPLPDSIHIAALLEHGRRERGIDICAMYNKTLWDYMQELQSEQRYQRRKYVETLAVIAVLAHFMLFAIYMKCVVAIINIYLLLLHICYNCNGVPCS